MARRLIAPGADLEATGVAISGGTALTHAVEFGNTEVVDEAAAAGAVVHDVVEAGGVSEVPIGSRAQAA